ncbi:tyrosine-type recombinase/integrase [Mangrovimonas cancribranchiae]|uniref:Tyrosine-type recombinase/integrase n=1 Tax=Mangrovimonas cancribranchiae TaxID=3080055 RepID=A0AAU6P5N1_9FLAO
MNIKYFIIPGKRKYSSIYVRFWDSKRVDQKTRTGLSVEKRNWSIKKQRFKIVISEEDNNLDLLNNKLDRLEKAIHKQYNKDYAESNHISRTWLKDVVNEFFNQVPEDQNHKKYFAEWAEKFVENSKDRTVNGKRLKANSLKNYTAALNKLKQYEKHRGIKLKFQDIDLEFYRDFVLYCNETLNLNNNSIGNLISRIKTFCSNIEIEGLPINPQYKHKEFKIPKNKTHHIYLNNKEIEKIFKHDFSESSKLDNARDLLIIGLRTGLRVSDFLRIKKENIFDNVINITTQKTNQNLTIPIHPQFRKILKKHNGNFPKKISDQKFNKYIKEVCEKAGIKNEVYGSLLDKKTKRKVEKHYPKHKLVTSHTCRRSFATNLFLEGIPNHIVMAATGHSSEKQYLAYVKATQEEHIERLQKHWKKQNKKQ